MATWGDSVGVFFVKTHDMWREYGKNIFLGQAAGR